MEFYIKLFSIAMAFVGGVGLVGNILVIIIYLYDKRLKSYTNYFFINLSVVDILIISVCLPVALLDLWNDGYWYLGKLLCQTQHFIESSLISVSSLTLISIAVERYFAISMPLQAKQLIKKRNIIFVLMAIWIVSIIFAMPFYSYTKFFIYINETSNQTIPYCYNDRSWLFPKIYQASFISLFLIVPSFILIGIYINIVLKLRRLNKRLSVKRKSRTNSGNSYSAITNSPSRNLNSIRNQSSAECDPVLSRNSSLLSRASPNSSKSSNNYSQLIMKRRQTIMICVISLAFFICQLPIKVFQIFNTFYEFTTVSDEKSRFMILNIIFLSAKLLYYLHGMSNPIIYNLMSSKFNQSFRKVILCKSLDYYPKKRNDCEVKI